MLISKLSSYGLNKDAPDTEYTKVCPKAGAVRVTGRLSGVVAPRLRQRYHSRSSRVPHPSAAVRTERCCTAGQSSGEVRARDAALLHDLHWLRVSQRVRDHPTLPVTSIALPIWTLVGVSARLPLTRSRTVPLTRLSTVGDRAFSVAAARPGVEQLAFLCDLVTIAVNV